MKRFKKLILVLFLFAFVENIRAQEINPVLTFEEYLGYVKEHHPLMKQANLTLSIAEANILRARGAFDPKIEVDYDRKKFKGTEYYDQFNATFKIPTWYGIEFKTNFEENTGEFLNPNVTLPEGGLYSAGVSFSLAQGFLINERMAALKQAKFFEKQSQADRDYLVNNLLFEASQAYFEWLAATNEVQIYSSFLQNAETRLNGVTRSVEEGEKAAIDITEARIILQNRQLDLEAATLNKRKAALKVGNYLWINSIPLILEDNVIPKLPTIDLLESILILEGITDIEQLAKNHPKIKSLEAKIESLQVDRNLKRNKLLPKVDLQYNFLSQDYEQLNSFNTNNYKAFVNVSFPLFLRKERGDLQLTNFKIKDAEFDQDAVSLTIANKISEINYEITSLEVQNQLISNIVSDYTSLVKAEERKFFLGESSLFLINAREQKLIDAQLKENSLTMKQLNAIASLYNALGVIEPRIQQK
jgi:outer membrane protein TolC